MLKIWDAILHKFNKVQSKLQKPDLDLSVTVKLYKALVLHVEELKNTFDLFFDEAKSIYLELDAEKHVQVYRGAITLANMDESKTKCQGALFIPVMHLLEENLNSRMEGYVKVADMFAFLVTLNKLSFNDIAAACSRTCSFYKTDVDEKELLSECEIAKNFFFDDESQEVSHASMYARIKKETLKSVFPNIEILLRIFLTLFVTNVPGERSFSTLKRIKTAQRNSLREEKLNALSLMSIEHGILDCLDLDEIIDEFLLAKNRKLNSKIAVQESVD